MLKAHPAPNPTISFYILYHSLILSLSISYIIPCAKRAWYFFVRTEADVDHSHRDPLYHAAVPALANSQDRDVGWKCHHDSRAVCAPNAVPIGGSDAYPNVY